VYGSFYGKAHFSFVGFSYLKDGFACDCPVFCFFCVHLAFCGRFGKYALTNAASMGEMLGFIYVTSFFLEKIGKFFEKFTQKPLQIYLFLV